MLERRISQRIVASDTGVLVLSALAVVALHTVTNGAYGFHRDELATIDDARFLAWGYVVYPPVTPFIARVSLTLFGGSMIGLRFFAALAMGIAMVLTGFMAREIGGRRPAQLVAAWAAMIAGPAVSFGYLFQYVSFDYLWWVLAAWVTIRLLRIPGLKARGTSAPYEHREHRNRNFETRLHGALRKNDVGVEQLRDPVLHDLGMNPWPGFSQTPAGTGRSNARQLELVEQ